MFYLLAQTKRVNTIKIIDGDSLNMQWKTKIAAEYIKNDNNNNETFFMLGQDNLYLDIISLFVFDINANIIETFHPSLWDNNTFKPWLSYIQGKRKTKMTEVRYKELHESVFRHVKYNAHNFFIQDQTNTWIYGGMCNFVLFNPAMDDNSIKQFYFYGWNKNDSDINLKVKDRNNIQLIHSYPDENYAYFNLNRSDFLKKVNLDNANFQDLDHFEYIEQDNNTTGLYYHYLINFKKFIKDYNFKKDLSKDEHCIVVDINKPEIRNEILNIYNNRFEHIKTLLMNKINSVNFISE